MNKLLKLKYYLHKLVNVLFYFIIFVIGFIFGLIVDFGGVC